MIMYLSGLLSLKNIDELDLSEVNVLQAFPYMKKNSHEYISKCKNFLMDSGAFTMMNSKSEWLLILSILKIWFQIN